jgi:hypothetical protein
VAAPIARMGAELGRTASAAMGVDVATVARGTKARAVCGAVVGTVTPRSAQVATEIAGGGVVDRAGGEAVTVVVTAVGAAMMSMGPRPLLSLLVMQPSSAASTTPKI